MGRDRGRQVVICRPQAACQPLARLVRAVGADPIMAPLSRVDRPADGGAGLAAAVARAATYSWVVATSANGVHALVDKLGDSSAWCSQGVKIAAVGPATARAFEAAGISVDLVPKQFNAAGLVLDFPLAPSCGGDNMVLAPLAELASDELEVGLTAKRWNVDRVDAYRMVPVAKDCIPSADELALADAVLFTAPSIVDEFLDRFGHASVPPLVVCIGPRTSKRASSYGLDPVTAHPHNDEGLIQALVGAWSLGL